MLISHDLGDREQLTDDSWTSTFFIVILTEKIGWQHFLNLKCQLAAKNTTIGVADLHE